MLNVAVGGLSDACETENTGFYGLLQIQCLCYKFNPYDSWHIWELTNIDTSVDPRESRSVDTFSWIGDNGI